MVIAAARPNAERPAILESGCVGKLPRVPSLHRRRTADLQGNLVCGRIGATDCVSQWNARTPALQPARVPAVTGRLQRSSLAGLLQMLLHRRCAGSHCLDGCL